MSVKHSILINHFQYKKERNWDKTFWAFDIHGTILKPNYQYGSTPDEFYPFAKECLQLISTLPDVCMILYTCSHPNEINEYLELFKQNGIQFEYVNENPEVATQPNGYGCYDKKLYMNVLFEDKAGFDPMTEWEEIYSFLNDHYYPIEVTPDVSKAYRNYLHYHNNHPTIHSNRFDILSEKDFNAKISKDNEFKEEWVK